MALPGLKNSINRHSVKKPSLSRAGGGSHRADGKGLKFKAAGAMTNTARSGIFSSRHAGSRGNFVYASSSSKLAKYGLHINRNGKISNKPNFSALRLALNGRSGGYSNNIRYVTPSYTTGNCSNCSGNSFMNTLSGIQQLMMMSQMLGLDNEKKTEGNEKKKTDGSGGSGSGSSAGTGSSLSSCSSFQQIANLEATNTKAINTAIGNYNANNKKSVLEDVFSSYSENKYLNGFDVSSLTTSKIDSDNVTEALKNIDTDIENFKNFQTTTLNDKQTEVSSAKGQLEGTISGLKQQSQQAEFNDPKADTSDLDDKLKNANYYLAKAKEAEEKLQKADITLDNKIAEMKNTRSTLETKKEKEDQIKDAKYDLAKQQDERLGKLNKKLSEQTKKLSEAKDNKKDKIRNEIESINTEIQSLTSSLAAGVAANGNNGTSFTNSKNKTYTLTNYTANNNTQTPAGGGNSTVNEDIYDYIGNPSYPDGSSLA